jgi:glycosyltransferase involved in cell wall biosynthesis
VKVAYFSPLPPERSGIADYSALLLPALQRRLEVTAVRRGRRRAPRGTEVALYHIGNNPDAHGWIVDALERRPGLVVLHEFVLHHLVAGLTLGRGDEEGYRRAMQREAGPVGRMLAHGVIDGFIPPLWEVRPTDFPLARPILSRAGGLIVHSRFVEELARGAGFAGPIWQIPMPAWPEAAVEPDSELAGRDGPLIGCMGHLVPSKRIGQLLTAFARLRTSFPGAVLVLAGATRGVQIGPRLEQLGLRPGEDVLILGHVEEDRLWALLAACDVCVSLRWPTMGETSGSVIRALGLGRPLVVSDVGWFSELPDGVAAKIPVDESEVDVLTGVLERLSGDPRLREQMGADARDYIRREHDLERVADLYAHACDEYVGGVAVEGELLGDVARAAHEVGIGTLDPELGETAKRMQESGLVR